MIGPGEHLDAIGMSAAGVAAKVLLYAQCDAALDSIGATTARRSLWVPGRIELLGKHTDYCGGESLLVAVERGFCVRYSARRDRTVRILDVTREEQCDTPLAIGRVGRPGEWSNYVSTVARRVGRDFPHVATGVDVALASDLPSAAGLSSSSALIVSVALAIMGSNDLDQTTEYRELFPATPDLAGYLGAVESGAAFGPLKGDAGIGTFGGSEDHVAMMCCMPGRISRYAFAPPRKIEDVPVPADHSLVVGVSGLSANKSGGARDRYNRTSLAVSHLLAAWNARHGRHDASLAMALQSGAGAHEALHAIIPTVASEQFPAAYLRDRLEHFIDESQRIVPAASECLRRGALRDLGALVDQSQLGAESLLGNQVPETVALQRIARETGAVAASAFGAGFGGSVWALIPSLRSTEFMTEWARLYRIAHPTRARRSTFFVSLAGPHAAAW